MRCLVAYASSQNLHSVLRQSLRKSTLTGVDWLAVTNAPILDLKSEVAPVFSGKFYRSALARNKSIDYAIKHEYDWLALTDSDYSLHGNLLVLPPSGFSILAVKRYNSAGQLSEFQTSSSWLINRSIFEKHRFDESFIGYGYQDIDYVYNTLWFAGVKSNSCPVTGVHYWHSVRGGRDRLAFNGSLCYAKMTKLATETGLEPCSFIYDRLHKAYGS